MTTITLNDKNPIVRRQEVRLYAASFALSQGALALGRMGNPMALAKEIEDYVLGETGEKQAEPKVVVTEPSGEPEGGGSESIGDLIEVDEAKAHVAPNGGPASLRQAGKK